MSNPDHVDHVDDPSGAAEVNKSSWPVTTPEDTADARYVMCTTCGGSGILCGTCNEADYACACPRFMGYDCEPCSGSGRLEIATAAVYDYTRCHCVVCTDGAQNEEPQVDKTTESATPWAIVCLEHQTVYLTEHEYTVQTHEDQFRCPKCTAPAEFDHDNYEAAMTAAEESLAENGHHEETP